MTYPEHEKMRNVRTESQAIGEFLEWLTNQGFTIERDGLSYGELAWKNMLAEFFGIDLKKIESEKRAMLELARKMYEEPRATFVTAMILNEAQASVALDHGEIGTYSLEEMPSHGDKGE